MTVLNSISQRKILEILTNLTGAGDTSILIEKDMLMTVMDQIDSIVRTSGLPEIKTRPIVNSRETEITSEYMTALQKEVYDAFTYYGDVTTQIGTDLNSVITVMSEYMDSIQKIVDTQGQSIDNIKHLILTKLNNNSILDEINIKFETKKAENMITSNVYITPGGSILLPTSLNQPANTSVKDASFKVLSPLQAEAPQSFNQNINGLSNNQAIYPGYFEGKFFGSFTAANDVRLSSSINYVLDGRNDTQWECEYVTNNEVSSSFQVLVEINFRTNQIINQIGIDTNAEARAFYFDSTGTKQYLVGSGTEYFTEFNGTKLYLELTQNMYKQITYQLDSIVKNGYLVHTYNTLETINHQTPSEFAIQFPDIKFAPIRLIEEQAAPEDIVLKTFNDKFRFAITLNNLFLKRNTYQTTGVMETIDIEVPNEIYGVEIDSNAYIPSIDYEWLKYSLSFDGGKTWNRIRPTNESATLFNSSLVQRIQLAGTTPDVDTLIIQQKSSKVRLKIEFATKDSAISPVVFGFTMRVKER